jgi:hypothetical protein
LNNLNKTFGLPLLAAIRLGGVDEPIGGQNVSLVLGREPA